MKPVLENLKIIGDKILVDIKNMEAGGDIQKVEQEIFSSSDEYWWNSSPQGPLACAILWNNLSEYLHRGLFATNLLPFVILAPVNALSLIPNRRINVIHVHLFSLFSKH